MTHTNLWRNIIDAKVMHLSTPYRDDTTEKIILISCHLAVPAVLDGHTFRCYGPQIPKNCLKKKVLFNL